MNKKPHGFINITLPAGWTYEQAQDELDRRWAECGIAPGDRDPALNWTNPAPRGRVLYGALPDVQGELDIAVGKARPPAEQDKRLAAIKTLHAAGDKPGRTIQWGAFAKKVRQACNMPPAARGFSPRQIRRLVERCGGLL